MRVSSWFLAASSRRGRRRSSPLLQIQRPQVCAMKLTFTPPLTPGHWIRSTDLTDAASVPLIGIYPTDVATIGGGFAGL